MARKKTAIRINADPADIYGEKLARGNATNLLRSRLGRDVAGDYPPPGDCARHRAAERDFRLFCETYFPAAFSLPWSPDHLRVIDRIQAAVLDGGLFALAMPRGSGKTTLCERAALWALLYGHRRFVCLVGATEAAAETTLSHLKIELSHNDLLATDFRHVCYPIRRLENNARRCIGQLFRGAQTNIVWSAKRITFPTMPDDACDGANVSGSTVTVAGLTGALRGQSHMLPDGEIIRPELVILDDPQTRESAMSPAQCADRLAIITGDVLGMAGPGRKIAAIMPCTVIRQGDLADQLLDRASNPQWQGERTRAVYSWPTNTERWEAYFRLRADGMRSGAGTAAATQYYIEHRWEMDAGAVVAWPERHNPDEISAVQHVMHLRADLGAEAFEAEYQNDPPDTTANQVPTLSPADICARLNGIKRCVVAAGAEHVTAFIDVHDSLLYWCVASWAGDFTGWVVDYGAYPEQHRRAFTLRQAAPTLVDAAPGAGREGAIVAGLTALVERLLSREWPTETGGHARIGRCLIDSGYVSDTAYDFCRRSAHAAILLPSRGIGVGAKSRPFSEYSRKPGERHGTNWLIGRTTSRGVQYVRYDANWWKSFVHSRLAMVVGDRGSLSLFGRAADAHKLFAEHLTAERPTRVSSGGRTVDEWALCPGRADNHWLDCLVGCAVAASIQGAALPGLDDGSPRKQRLGYAERYAQWRRTR